MSLFGAIFSYFLFTRGIQTVSASSVAVITTVEPLVAIMLAGAFLGEHLTVLQYVGISLIVVCGMLSGLSKVGSHKPSNVDSRLIDSPSIK